MFDAVFRIPPFLVDGQISSKSDLVLFSTQNGLGTRCSKKVINKFYPSFTTVKYGKNLVRTWVEFGKKMVSGKQAVAKGRFWPFFGLFRSELLTILRGVFGILPNIFYTDSVFFVIRFVFVEKNSRICRKNAVEIRIIMG